MRRCGGVVGGGGGFFCSFFLLGGGGMRGENAGGRCPIPVSPQQDPDVCDTVGRASRAPVVETKNAGCAGADHSWSRAQRGRQAGHGVEHAVAAAAVVKLRLANGQQPGKPGQRSRRSKPTATAAHPGAKTSPIKVCIVARPAANAAPGGGHQCGDVGLRYRYGVAGWAAVRAAGRRAVTSGPEMLCAIGRSNAPRSAAGHTRSRNRPAGRVAHCKRAGWSRCRRRPLGDAGRTARAGRPRDEPKTQRTAVGDSRPPSSRRPSLRTRALAATGANAT